MDGFSVYLGECCSVFQTEVFRRLTKAISLIESGIENLLTDNSAIIELASSGMHCQSNMK